MKSPNKSSIALLGIAGLMLALVGAHRLFPGLSQRWYHRVFLGEDFISPDVQFKRTMTAVWLNPGGPENARKPEEITYAWYSSSDWVEVLVQREIYSSDVAATKKMEELVSNAPSVLERNERIDMYGERVGPRAVLITEGRDLPAVIVWTNGNVVVTVESSSLPHALEIEKGGSSRMNQPRR